MKYDCEICECCVIIILFLKKIHEKLQIFIEFLNKKFKFVKVTNEMKI